MNKSKSFNLFLVSCLIITSTLLLATFWDILALGGNKIPLALAITVAFGISIGGIVVGFTELKEGSTKVKVGIWGNVLVLLFFIITIFYTIYGMK